MTRKLASEADVKTVTKQWYAEHGGWSWAPVSNGMGVHGVADRVGVVPCIITPAMVGKRIGLFLAVESKRPGRRGEPDRGMSKHQVMFMESVQAAGGISICCDGYEDLADLDRELHALTGV